MKKLFLSIAVSALCALPAFAGDDGTRHDRNDRDAKNFNEPILSQNIDKEDYYRSHEWFVDLYGSYTAPTHGYINAGPGGGVGIGYFFTKNFGLDVEGLGFDGGPDADTVTTANLNLIGRLPLDCWLKGFHLAPYAFVGGGEQFSTLKDEPFWDAGLGVEYRFTPHWGVFTDGRYVDTQETNHYGLARLGVRYAF